MTVTLDLPDDALRRLRAEATRRGVELAEVVTDLASRLPQAQAAAPVRRKLAFVGVGASQSGITPRIDALLDEGFGR